jgi:plasmid stabilization system protein ParE
VSERYFVRPKADEDLDSQASYLAEQTNADVGHRFLIAANETFSLLATQPHMG